MMGRIERARVAALFAMTFCWLTAGTVRAEQTGEALVTTSGQATAKKEPEVLRMTLIVTAEGKDAKEAISKLSVERDAVKGKLASLGATEKSVQFDDAMVGAGAGDPRQQQMRTYMMARGGKKPTSQPQVTTVSTTVRAEWPLKPDAPADDRLVAATELQEKIKAAFAKSVKAPTPEEQEVLEEMASSGMQDDQSKPGEPRFVFVRSISDEEHAKLTTEALAGAKAEAARLAAAAGAQLGAIRQLSSVSNTESGAGENENPYAVYYQAMGRSQGLATAGGKHAVEAVGSQAGNVTFTVNVSATFSLK